MYSLICEIDRQSRFYAWDRVLRAGALGWPWGMGWGGRWKGGSGWETHVHQWLIHLNVWQKPPQGKVISLQLKFLKKHPQFINNRCSLVPKDAEMCVSCDFHTMKFSFYCIIFQALKYIKYYAKYLQIIAHEPHKNI